MAKGKQRGDASAVIMPVPNVQALAVKNLQILTGPVMPRGRVLDTSRESRLSS